MIPVLNRLILKLYKKILKNQHEKWANKYYQKFMKDYPHASEHFEPIKKIIDAEVNRVRVMGNDSILKCSVIAAFIWFWYRVIPGTLVFGVVANFSFHELVNALFMWVGTIILVPIFYYYRMTGGIKSVISKYTEEKGILKPLSNSPAVINNTTTLKSFLTDSYQTMVSQGLEPLDTNVNNDSVDYKVTNLFQPPVTKSSSASNANSPLPV